MYSRFFILLTPVLLAACNSSSDGANAHTKNLTPKQISNLMQQPVSTLSNQQIQTLLNQPKGALTSQQITQLKNQIGGLGPVTSKVGGINNTVQFAPKGNIFAVINGLLEKANVSQNSIVKHYDKITVSNNVPLFRGADIVNTHIQFSTSPLPAKGGPAKATIIIQNGNDWHCYKSTQLSAQRDANVLTVDGDIAEYAYDYTAQQCGKYLVASYVFKNAKMDAKLKLTQAGTTFSIDSSGSKNALYTYEFLAKAYGDQLEDSFGHAWLSIQGPHILAAAKNTGDALFNVDNHGLVTLSVGSSVNTDVYDFKALTGSQILDGTVFGGNPGGNVASENWCKIVNIPKGVTSSALEYQTVIATNCARSTPRYCDAHGKDPAGVYPAVSPVAWDDSLKTDAQITSDEQYNRNAQGHWGSRNAQNAFVLESKSAIIPIIGYTEPRTDGNKNNAGHSSWAGHEGHCQNVMRAGHTIVGIASRDTNPSAKAGIQSFWAQDFK
ncbi:CAP domain-containing protein [Vibrio splendidus]